MDVGLTGIVTVARVVLVDAVEFTGIGVTVTVVIIALGLRVVLLGEAGMRVEEREVIVEVAALAETLADG